MDLLHSRLVGEQQLHLVQDCVGVHMVQRDA
jgi:hypothetical protein